MNTKFEKLKPNINLQGFSWALFVWAFEAIPILGETFGEPSTQSPLPLPRLQRWFVKKPTIPDYDKMSLVFENNKKDLEDKADDKIDELTKEIDGRPMVSTNHNMHETVSSRQPSEGVGVIFSSLDHGICASLADVDKTVSVVSFQDKSSPLDDRTCDYHVDACKHASYTGVSVVPSSLDRGIYASPMDVHRTAVVASSQGVVSSSPDLGICSSPTDADKTVVVASSQDTSSSLDDRTYNSQVDACKDISPMGVGVVPSSPDQGIFASP
ncbi:hypothetical protein RDI58_028810 [Solanum bulbocastanum]|uniref:Uncharacterized protein n=1 Tax=Solanum bulbocastanum TaxID=147425 RepID=A0AAN8STD0_SOLBU